MTPLLIKFGESETVARSFAMLDKNLSGQLVVLGADDPGKMTFHTLDFHWDFLGHGDGFVSERVVPIPRPA